MGGGCLNFSLIVDGNLYFNIDLVMVVTMEKGDLDLLIIIIAFTLMGCLNYS